MFKTHFLSDMTQQNYIIVGQSTSNEVELHERTQCIRGPVADLCEYVWKK